MDSFSQIAAVVSIIIGLGMTRLLSGGIVLFRGRHRSRVDWIPLVWAGILFLVIVQFWWSVNHIPPGFSGWSIESVVALSLLTCLLFVSAALLLPQSEADQATDLAQFFENEGRWSLLFFALYNLATIAANGFFFGADVRQLWAALSLIEVALPLVAFFTPTRRVRAITTLGAAVVFVAILVLFTDARFDATLRMGF